MESSQIVRVVRIPKRVTNGKLEFIQWGDGGRENGYVGCMCDPHLRGGSRRGTPSLVREAWGCVKSLGMLQPLV